MTKDCTGGGTIIGALPSKETTNFLNGDGQGVRVRTRSIKKLPDLSSTN